jgi:hypothetical protein
MQMTEQLPPKAITLVSLDSVFNGTSRYTPINVNATFYMTNTKLAKSEINNLYSNWLNTTGIWSNHSTNLSSGLMTTKTSNAETSLQYANPLQYTQSYYMPAVPIHPDIATVNSNTYIPAIGTWLILIVLMGLLYGIRRKFNLSI